MAEHDTVEVSIRLAAKPETVFRFLSDPDRVRQWLGDASLGGALREPVVVRYPDGGLARGTIQEIVPDRRVVFTWGYDDASRGLAPGSTRVSIDLAPIPSGTIVTLRHSGLPTDTMRREHRMGWRHYVSALANAATSITGVAERAVDAYQTAWAERDPNARAKILDGCWAADATFRDAMGYAEGRVDLSDYIAAAQRFASNLSFERVGAIAHAHGFVQYRWRFRAPDGNVVMAGSNVGELSPDGLLLNMVGFWEQPAPPAA